MCFVGCASAHGVRSAPKTCAKAHPTEHKDAMNAVPQPILDRLAAVNRRTFLQRSAAGIGMAALGSLLNPQSAIANSQSTLPHYAAKAKRIIYLFQSGAPSQMDL